ncbi:MAG: hypothetical protein KC912_06150 [Proteobacteria bacterium]|nr:hypothetical protein [Pseudomonadota bacterium]
MIALLITLASAEPVDFTTAVDLQFADNSDGPTLTMTVAPGFHIYGAREKQATPLRLNFDHRGRARIPKGSRHEGAVGTQWILEDVVTIPLALRSSGPATGTLTYQACYETLCAPPTTVDWALPR